MINLALFAAILCSLHLIHHWEDATCTEPRTCRDCGKTMGQALGHKWKEATCTEPRTCIVCGETEGKALGHRWDEATCTNPKTCRVCGAQEGVALGHKWDEATCTKPKTCRVCRVIEGSALGHDWKEADYDEPRTCRRCGETSGFVKGFVPGYKLADGKFADQPVSLGDYVVYPWIFNNELKKCRKIKIGVTLYVKKGKPFGAFECWIRSDGNWKKTGSFTISESEKEYINTFVISPACDVDAIMFEPRDRKKDETSWNDALTFYEAQVE